MVRSIAGKHPNYYEAILQLRLPNQKVVDYVEKELLRVKMPVAKVIELKNGLDYYLADNQFTLGLGKRLQVRFGGQVLVTSSLFSQKDGKEIYRTTVLFRKAPFSKGDIVIYGDEEYIVKSSVKEIVLIGIKNKKKIRMKYKDMKQIKLKSD